MAVSKIPSAGIDSGGVAPSNLSTGAPSWDSSGNLSFNSGYGSVATAYGCRAWVNFNGTGTPAIRGSGNVSSITDNGTGDYTVNFTTAMPDTNYAVFGLGSDNQDGSSAAICIFDSQGGGTDQTTTAVRIATQNPFDPLRVCVSIFR